MQRKAAVYPYLGKAAGILCVAMILAGAAHAQIPTSGNVFLGYSYSRGNAFTGSPSVALPTAGSVNMNGWEISAEGKFLPFLGVVADFDWHYGSRNVSPACFPPACTNTTPFRLNASRHELLIGPRASVSVGRYRPFAELLLGFAHQTDTGRGVSNSDTSFATGVGAGLDYELIKGVHWRLEGDSIHTGLFGSGHNNLRLSTGVVFNF